MSSTVYDAISAWLLLPANGLCPTPFAEIYDGSPPEGEKFPFAVMTMGEGSDAGLSRENHYHKQGFKVEIVTRTTDQGKQYGLALKNAVEDKEEQINAMGLIGVVSLDYKTTTGPSEQALDVWLTTVEFSCLYAEPRTA